MKKLIYTALFVVSAMMCAQQTAWACNRSDLFLTGVTSLGSGLYQVNVQFCVGAGRTGAAMGADTHTSDFAFFLSSNASFVSYPTSIVSPNTGYTFEDTLFGDDTLVYYNAAYQKWACVSSTASCGQIQTICYDFTFVTNGLPDSIWVRGAEADGNILYAGCMDQEMTVYPAATACGIQPNASITPTTCANNNGAVSLSPSGGTAPYSYNWSTGGSTSSISSLAAGAYAVTITDANCSLGRAFYVTSSSSLVASGTASNYDCATELGTITMSPTGGTSPYTYAWSNSATTATISNLSSGTYTVTVTDAAACTATNSFTITTVSALAANGVVTHYDCASSKGSINLSPSGGQPPYSFNWSNGATTEDVSNLNAGSYTVTISHNGGACTKSFGFTVNSAPVTANLGSDATVYYGYSPMACNTLNPAPSGGGTPYTYSWSTGATSSTLNVCPTSTTTYTVTVTDARGCTATDSKQVNVVDVRCGLLLTNVKVCHSGQNKCYASNQVAGHLGHGDYLGGCHSKMYPVLPNSVPTATMEAWPSPADEHVQIHIGASDDGVYSLEAMDLMGKQLANWPNFHVTASDGHTLRWSVRELPAGVYLIRLHGSTGPVQTSRIVVSH